MPAAAKIRQDFRGLRRRFEVVWQPKMRSNTFCILIIDFISSMEYIRLSLAHGERFLEGVLVRRSRVVASPDAVSGRAGEVRETCYSG